MTIGVVFPMNYRSRNFRENRTSSLVFQPFLSVSLVLFRSCIRALCIFFSVCVARVGAWSATASVMPVSIESSMRDLPSSLWDIRNRKFRGCLLPMALFAKHLALRKLCLSNVLSHIPLHGKKLCRWVDVIHLKVIERAAFFARSVVFQPLGFLFVPKCVILNPAKFSILHA